MGHVSAYHMKKIGGWFSVGDFQPATRLEDGEYYDCAGNGVNLKSMLLDPLPEVKLGYKRIVSAQTGHILTSAAPTGNQMNFLPPIAGANPLVPLAKSVVQAKDGLGSRTFVGSAPPSITQGESFTPSSLFTRLVYRARPVLAKISEIGPKTPVAQQTLVFEVEHENTSASGERPSTPIMRCYMGTETRVDVALPDRPLDLSFKAFDSIEILSASIPKRLKEYARRLAQDKETGVINDPLDSFTYGTHQFYLDQSVMVEHSVSDTRIIEVTTDIDSQVKSSSCLIECTDVAVDESWRSFLRKCDHISSQPYHRPQAKFIPHVTTILD
ncbi:hypothetical protein FRB99_008555 [Tulasnella sp. 403]|nr:hypothetical protein FRB99_008555 [Tulasnella sp. 403]